MGGKLDEKTRQRGIPSVWYQPDGLPVSCVEKIKVLNQNIDEIQQLAQDALEDAVLMGCDEAQVRAVLREIVDDIVNPYAGRTGRGSGR